MEWGSNPFTPFLLFPPGSKITSASESAALGLERAECGMLLCVDDDGERWTLLGDAEYVRTLETAPDWISRGLVIPWKKLPERRRGWPDNWAGDTTNGSGFSSTDDSGLADRL
jgi:hypothetical protein